MRIVKNTQHIKRNIVILSVIGLVAIGGAASWYFLNLNAQSPSENTVSYEPATDEQMSAGLNAKEAFNKVHYDDANKQAAQDSSNSEAKKGVNLLISSMNQTGDTLTIATSIEGLDDSGTCNLKMTREESDTITAQVGTIKMTSYSACEDFNVNVAGLEKGEWNVQVDYVGTLSKGSTSTKVAIR